MSNARVPVGADGRLLQADSAQTLGVGYSTRDFDGNAKNFTNIVNSHAGSFIGDLINGPSDHAFFINYTYSGVASGNDIFCLINPTLNYTSTSTQSFRAFYVAPTLNVSNGLTMSECITFHSQVSYFGTGSTFSGTNAGSAAFTAEDYVGGNGSIPTFTNYRNFYAWPTINGNITNLYGFYYSPKQITGGTITNEWSFAADRGNAYLNGLTMFGSTSTPSAPVHIGGVGQAAPTNVQAAILDNHARTVASNVGGYYGWLMNGSITGTAAQGFGFAASIGLKETWHLNAAIADFATIQVQSQITGTTAPSNAIVLYFTPTFNFASGTNAQLIGIMVDPVCTGGFITTQYTGVAIGNGLSAGSTIGTTVGLDIGIKNPLAGTTIWGMQVGNYQSYHQGPLALGGTTAPTWTLHMQGNTMQTGIGFDVSASHAPTLPANNAGAVMTVYKGATSGALYLLIATVFGGSTVYYSLKISATASSWVSNGSTLPT